MLYKFLELVKRVDREIQTTGDRCRIDAFQTWIGEVNDVEIMETFERDLTCFETDCLFYYVEVVRGKLPNGLEIEQLSFEDSGFSYEGVAYVSTIEAHDWLLSFLIGSYAADRIRSRKLEALEKANAELRAA